MVWLHRFLLGLKPRAEDILEIRNNFPELLAEPETIKNLTPNIIGLFLIDFHKNDLVNKFKEWLNNQEKIPSDKQIAPEFCPVINCPMKNGEVLPEDKDEVQILSLMSVAGEKGHEPKKAFLDLVKKVHKNSKGSDIKQVIITDPYIFNDISQDGKTGGLSNLVEYLNTLEIYENHEFELKVNNMGKIPTTFTKQMKAHFKKIKILNHKANESFHDRFYLVKDTKGNFKGIFGPSINAINSYSVVIFCELEENVIKKIVSMVDEESSKYKKNTKRKKS